VDHTPDDNAGSDTCRLGIPQRSQALIALMASNRAITSLLAGLRRFRRDSRGMALVEFGLLGPLFIVLLCGILENGLILFTQTVLDNATRDASRLVLLGNTSSSSFATALCNGVGGIIPCSKIKFNVQSGAGFSGLSSTLQTDTNGDMTNNQFAPGTYSQDVLIQVSYNRPFLVPLYGMFSGVNSELLVSTVALKSEPY